MSNTMTKLKTEVVENALTKVIEEVKNVLRLNVAVNVDMAPGNSGISSQVLVTVIGRIGNKLGVAVPNGCYLFYDKKRKKQLTIREAAQKLIKAVTNEN